MPSTLEHPGSPLARSAHPPRAAGWRVAAVLVLALSWAWAAAARDCRNCGTAGLPDLIMVCPGCGQNLLTPQTRRAERATAVLIVEIRYTGNNPDRLPAYGKVFINDTYRGDLPLTAKEARPAVTQAGRSGLGAEFTAIYRGEWRNLDIGQIRVRVEMKFRRAYGLARSHKELVFPFVMLRSGEKTILRHAFDSARRFGKREAATASAARSLVDGPRVVAGSGTIGIEAATAP